MYISLSDRYRIVFLHQDPQGPKWGYKRIAKELKYDVNSIKYWIKRYEINKDLFDEKKSGRKRKTSENEDKEMSQIAISKKPSTTRSIAAQMTSSGTPVGYVTVSKRLKEQNLKYQKPLKKPLLNLTHCKKRLDWAKKHMDYDWKKCIFTNECTFELNKTPYKECQSSESRSIIRKVKHPKKLHVWGCFSYFGFGQLFIFEENLDSNLLVKIYNECLLPSISNLFPDPSLSWILQEDNDPKHTSKKSIKYKEDNGINRLEWPACSPDLNPIENVWSLLKYKVYQKNPNSISQLKKIIKDEWRSFDKTYCENLVLSMKNRIKSCIEAQGDYTCY